MPEYPEFSDFMHIEKPTFYERMLIQAIAMLSTVGNYSDLTVKEIYDLIKEETIDIIKGDY